MKNILLAAVSITALAALGGCVGYPGGYSSGAWAGYDGGFDDGYHGYERPITWDDAYRQPVSYAPPPSYYYPPQAYRPQASGWYSTYYCPPQMQMGGY